MTSHHARLREILALYCRLEVGSGHVTEVTQLLSFELALVDPAAHGVGCYAIFSSGDLLRHIGMSKSRIKTRLQSHSRTSTNDEFWRRHPPNSFALIKLLDPDEAPLLEQYLTYHTKALREETWDYANHKSAER